MADKPIIPKQQEGAEKNITDSVIATDDTAAGQLYAAARKRLLLVNEWAAICEGLSAEFALTDDAGNEVQREAATGDHFRINIPGPGSKAGNGYDWVRIEAIEEDMDPGGQWQFIALRVRPSENPLEHSGETAHFLTSAGTSSFIVRRDQQIVSAGVYGRNEAPNPSGKGVGDAIRNTMVALGAIGGLANVQWNKLVKGLLGKE